MGMSERIDRVLDDLVKSGAAPGVAAIVVNDQGPLYQGAAGTKGVGRSEPMTLDTIFWYASMTKALVAAGAMQLIEQGRLKLDEPASNILPELSSVQVLDGFEADGAPKLRPAKRPITPRQLLTHTAGFGYNWATASSSVIWKNMTFPISFTASGARSTSRCWPSQAIGGNTASASTGLGS
jgi:methyl acetate hydrolase